MSTDATALREAINKANDDEITSLREENAALRAEVARLGQQERLATA